MGQPLRKAVWQFLMKLKIFLPYHLAFTFLRIYTSELKTHVYTKIRTQMFIAALFKMPKLGSSQDVF